VGQGARDGRSRGARWWVTPPRVVRSVARLPLPPLFQHNFHMRLPLEGPRPGALQTATTRAPVNEFIFGPRTPSGDAGGRYLVVERRACGCEGGCRGGQSGGSQGSGAEGGEGGRDFSRSERGFPIAFLCACLDWAPPSHRIAPCLLRRFPKGRTPPRGPHMQRLSSPSTQLIERDLSSPTLGGARLACRRLRGAVTSRALPSSFPPPLPPRSLGTGWKEGRWRRPHHHLSNVCGEHGDFPCPRAPPFTCSTRHPSAPGVRVCAAFMFTSSCPR
jgi:hypothetical protein